MDIAETYAPGMADVIPGAARWVSDKEGLKPVPEVGVVEIVGVEPWGQFDTMYLSAGVLGQYVGDFSAGRSTGLIAIEHQDDPGSPAQQLELNAGELVSFELFREGFQVFGFGLSLSDVGKELLDLLDSDFRRKAHTANAQGIPFGHDGSGSGRTLVIEPHHLLVDKVAPGDGFDGYFARVAGAILKIFMET